MPRKPAALRLSETRNLICSYEEAGVPKSKAYYFLLDMEDKLSRKKAVSKKQREWLDTLIDEGVPKIKGDKKLFDSICEGVKVFLEGAHGWEVNVLEDFRARVYHGYDLSAKQLNLIETLLKRAEVINNKVSALSEEQIEDVKLLVKLFRGYCESWQYSRPGLTTAVIKAETHISKNEAWRISDWQYQKMLSAMKTRLNKIKNPRFEIGSLAYAQYSAIPIIISSPPEVNERGDIVYLCTGGTGIKQYKEEKLRKRAPRK